MARKGTGLLMVWADEPAGKEDEFNRWYKVQANPTEWTKRSGPATIASAPMAPVLQIGRMAVPPAVDSDFNTWYNTVYVPNYEKVPGVIRGRRYRAVEGTPTYLTLYEFEDPKVSETPAWMAQRDASPMNAQK